MSKIISNKMGEVQRSNSISFIRFVSLIMIIICHIFQYLSIELAWWFNSGVQIFLCISGFLYGQKHIGDVGDFYKRRFKKICIPFYIVLIPAVAINYVCKNISLLTAGRALLMNTTFSGAGHLWFVPTVLLCYVISPILESFYMCVSRKKYIITTLFAIVITALFCFLFTDFYNGAWIGCYVIGYAIGVNEEKGYFSQKVLLLFFGAFASLNIIQIYIDYIARIELSGIIRKVYGVFKLYNHVWLGVFLFLLLTTIFDKYDLKHIKRALNISDKYSYEAYLVHQFVILGPFSLMTVTPYILLNIIIICSSIAILAWIVKLVSIRILKVLP